ncbi:MAG: hydantoinase/oxoprolinase family protein [Ferrovibrio sp.]|uniref:hydantoinase/oxoprolinase family protein n=1 Tax=Ferrovibrio sp. TaxID=1917215 RepID=UPI002604E69B|nr:hydantoinase/oxoprolinase family protein [Ferrovibrio sp.]MCW0235047.1 hydantoinase/oxoprolinase family protein [Ferrovibrio sp.]
MNAAVSWSIGIDVGGTYVDVVAVDGAGGYRRQKIPRIDSDPAVSVLAALDDSLQAMAIAPAAITQVAHGSTLVTNMLLERRAPPIAVVTNRGFSDLLLIGRQNRADLYTLTPAPQTPKDLFPDALRFEIAGRCDASGTEVEPLDPAALTELANRIAASGAAAVAVCLLHSIRNPAHEMAVGEALEAAKPDLFVSLSHQVDVAPGEYERFLATALDAYVKPSTRHYLDALAAGLLARGLPEPAIVTSDAGLRSPAAVAANPLSLALAGPAAAMSGFHLHGIGRHEEPVTCISVETGGTTTDIGLIEQGSVVCGRKVEIGGLSISLRATDILSVPVGGGSVVQINQAGALRLGPQSMGSLPGPAAYGRGGTLPTLTDALVVLGRLPATLAGGLALDTAAARRVMGDIAETLGCDVVAAATAVVAAAATTIAEGVKAHAYRHGIDPTGVRLIAGGGGGAQHAAEVAELLGSDSVLIPADSGMVSALGCLAAPESAASECALDLALSDAAWPALMKAVQAIAVQADPDTAIAWSLEAVYQGQSAALEFPFHLDRDDAVTLARRFDQVHERIRGHAFARTARLLRLRGQWVKRPAVLQKTVGAETLVTAGESDRIGPVAIFTETTSLWIPAGWFCRQEADGTLEMRHTREPETHRHKLKGAA